MGKRKEKKGKSETKEEGEMSPYPVISGKYYKNVYVVENEYSFPVETLFFLSGEYWLRYDNFHLLLLQLSVLVNKNSGDISSAP